MNKASYFLYLKIWLFVISINWYNIHAQKPNTYLTNSTSVLAVQSFLPSEVQLTESWVKNRETVNIDILKKLEADRLLHNFRINAGINSRVKPLEGWESPNSGLRGHFVGHFLSAAARWINESDDTALQNKVNYIIDALYECQQNNAVKYLSAFPESDFTILEKKFGGVWAPYYTYHKIMQGMLDVYTLTGNPKAYKIVLNMADYVALRMQKLSKDSIEKMLYSVEANPTNEAGGMNEVLHNLYAISKNENHLALAKLFDRKWFYQPLSDGKDILSGLHSNTHIVLIKGYAARFDNTRELPFKKAVINFWDILMNHHAYVNGSSSGPRPISTTPTSRTSEHWGNPDHLSATLTGHIAEACVIHNTQKISSHLFRWTANPKYANAYMNTFYNAVIPSQNSLDGRVVYHLPLGSPRKKDYLKENDFRCCNGTAIEAFTQLNSNIYFHNQDNLYINLFVPSILTWKEKSVKVQQFGNFPESAKSTIVIATNGPTKFGLNILIPSWANSATKLLVNGKPLNIKVQPASFVKIDRNWNNGDQVELAFEYKFYIQTMPDNKNIISIYYGPTLLAFETEKEIILKGNQQIVLQNLSKELHGYLFKLNNNHITYTLKPFYSISNESYGVYGSIRNDY